MSNLSGSTPEQVKAILPRLSKKLLEVSAQIEQDEMRIKQYILAAAERHDFVEIVMVIKRWMKLPPGSVLARPSK